MIQISFDTYEVNENNPRIVKEYYLKDETNTVLFDSLRFKHINIDKSKNAWYNNTIQKERLEDQNLIRFGAAMMMNTKNDFLKSMESVIMDEEIKKDIEEAVIEYSEDPNAWLYFDVEKDRIASENARISYAKKEARAEGHAEGLSLGIAQRNIEIAKNLLKKGISIDDIIDITSLPKEKIEELK